MNHTVSLEIDGPAVGQPRQRHRIAGAPGALFVQNYTPASHKVTGFKAEIELRFKAARPPGWPSGDGWVYRLLVVEVRKAPKAAKKAAPATPNGNKPDSDNVLKAVKDALKAAGAYPDDCRVYDERAVKVTAAAGRPGRVFIRLTAEPAGAVADEWQAVLNWDSQTVAVP